MNASGDFSKGTKKAASSRPLVSLVKLQTRMVDKESPWCLQVAVHRLTWLAPFVHIDSSILTKTELDGAELNQTALHLQTLPPRYAIHG